MDWSKFCLCSSQLLLAVIFLLLIKKKWSLRFLIDELYFYYGEFMRIKLEVGRMIL
jgi:hypothetical protein